MIQKIAAILGRKARRWQRQISSAPRRALSARRMLAIIGDKWTPIILFCPSGRVRRFNEMQRQIPDISKKMLIQVVRSPENDGLGERTVYPVVPPKTEYRLTEAGFLPARSCCCAVPMG